jgi:hydroxymethylbilane synthase
MRAKDRGGCSTAARRGAEVRVVLGTRGSALARWQARHVAARLAERHPGLEVEETIIATEGDLRAEAPLAGSDVGLFVRHIEHALLERRIDLAVHSLKDLPTEQPAGLTLAAIPQRHDPRDALLSLAGHTLDELPAGTRIGTGSPRRRSQLLHVRPDLDIAPIRGNVDTRVRKLERGEYGAIVLALAGVERLGIASVPYRPIDPEVCLPAVGQGALAIETRADDDRTRELAAVLDDGDTRRAVEAERAFLRELGGGCLAPATAWATIADGELTLRAAVGDADELELLRDEERGPADEGPDIGRRLARRMAAAGAARLIGLSRAAARRPGVR